MISELFDDVLDRVSDLAERERKIRDELPLWVGRAREAGATWQEIADAAGLAKQVAYRRWDSNGKEYHRKAMAKVRAQARGELPFSEAVQSLRGQRDTRWIRKQTRLT